MANDSTVKAGSWGKRTVEKILRIQERAERLQVPLVYLVDSAGARITDQIEMFPGRRGAGRIFHNQCRLSGLVPAGLPALRPVGRRRRVHPGLLRRGLHGRGQREHVPRLAAHGRDGDRPEDDARGDGRRAHALLGLGLRRPAREDRGGGDRRGARVPRRICRCEPARRCPLRRRASRRRRIRAELEAVIPRDENKPFDMREVIERLIDADSFFELKKLFAGELLTGFARIDGRPRRASSRTSRR